MPAVETPAYDFHAIEPKWQAFWDEIGLYRATEDDPRQKYYCLVMFPYPSGTLHVGHGRNYILGDAVVRYKMMRGFNVLTPMGWDAFGLPAEQYAIKVGRHPRDTATENIARMKEQFRAWGVGYDWDREVASCLPDYYKWTQWLFLRFYEKGLVYRKNATVNWSPTLQTVLANEQVVDGKDERTGNPVVQKDLEQWFYRITEYAQQLLDDHDQLQWPDDVIKRQKNWIGRSEGCHIDFPLDAKLEAAPDSVCATADDFPTHGVRREEETGDVLLRVFTTRPDTVYGVTFMTIAPEHPLVDALLNDPACSLTKKQKAEVRAYVEDCKKKSNLEREAGAKEKTGLFLGHTVRNPLAVPGGDADWEIPLYVGDYVLMYGTGIVMAVPSGDQRDFEFAKAKDVRIVKIMTPPDGKALSKDQWTQFYGGDNDDKEALAEAVREKGFPEAIEDWQAAYTGEGTSFASGPHTGLSTADMKKAVATALAEKKRGGETINYRLRDWLLSRQRYWGCPIPMIRCDDCGWVKVPDADLPVLLPDDIQFKGLVGNPLKQSESFLQTTCPSCGKPATRETDTMDTFVDSSWYLYRYLDPRNTDLPFSRERADFWGPVDQYIGGSEHSNGHLIYVRFFTKVLRDLGLLSYDEPAQRLFSQGMIGKPAVWRKEVGWQTQEDYAALLVKGFKDAGATATWDPQKPDSAGYPVIHVTDYPEGDLREFDIEVRHVLQSEFAKSQEPWAKAVRAVNKAMDVRIEYHKMSKSKYNVVDPAYLIDRYGADTQRLYTLFIGPPVKEAEWNDDAVVGCFRFLNRLWDHVQEYAPLFAGKPNAKVKEYTEAAKTLRRSTHTTIESVTRDLEHGFQFNTAIARIMEHATAMRQLGNAWKDADDAAGQNADASERVAMTEAIATSLQLLAPFVPHFAEELWRLIGRDGSIFQTAWPEPVAEWLTVDEVEIPVQIKGKLRGRITIAAEADQATAMAAAQADEKVSPHLEGKTVRKVIYVPGRMLNIIAT